MRQHDGLLVRSHRHWLQFQLDCFTRVVIYSRGFVFTPDTRIVYDFFFRFFGDLIFQNKDRILCPMVCEFEIGSKHSLATFHDPASPCAFTSRDEVLARFYQQFQFSVLRRRFVQSA